MAPLPKEKDVVKIFVHNKEKQKELIEELWRKFMQKRRYTINQYISIIMEVLRNSKNKAKDIIFSYATVGSIMNTKDNYDDQAGESKQRREGGKEKVDKEEKINRIWEITKPMSQKLKEELEIASQHNEELRLQNNNLKE